MNKKTNYIKYIIFASIIALLSCVCGFFCINFKSVYALDVSYKIDDGTNLKMTTGASIRTVSQEGSGLRFLVEYKKSYVDNLTNSGQYSEISFGAFIVPNTYRSNFPITHQGLAGKTVLEIPITSFLSDTSNGYYKAYATMTDIRPNNYDRRFLSRHYVKLVRTNGNVEYIYAPLATEPRSVYQVAKMAYGDRNSATSSNYKYDTSKSGNYKYSPYSSSQLAIIKTYIDGVVILDKNTLAYAGELDANLYTPAYSVVNNTISSSSKIVKMYWNDSKNIDASFINNYGIINSLIDENYLHIRNISDSDYALIKQNGTSDYKIVYPTSMKNDADSIKAVNELQKLIKEATNCELPIFSDSQCLDSENIISIGKTIQSQNVSLNNKLEKKYGNQAYLITNVGSSIYCVGNSSKADLYAVYDFLSIQFGFDTFAIDESTSGPSTLPIYYTGATNIDCYTLDKSSGLVKLKNLFIIEKPDFESRVTGSLYYAQPIIQHEKADRLKLQYMNEPFCGTFAHNFFELVPPGDENNANSNYNKHPKWFSEHYVVEAGNTYDYFNYYAPPKRTWWKSAYDGFLKNGQLCLTCHGDNSERQLLIDTVVESMKKQLLNDTTHDLIAFCQNDGSLWCECKTCKADKNLYDNEETYKFATLIRFVNEVATKIKAWNTTNCPNRDIKIVIYAYGGISHAPVKLDSNKIPILDSNGNYQPYANDLILKDNVSVMYCMGYNLNDEADIDTDVILDRKENLQRINNIMVEPSILYWFYSAKFSNYLLPLDVISTRQGFYKLAKQYGGGIYILDLTKFDDRNSTSFNTLQEYVSAKLLWNCNLNVEDLILNFCDNYYGVASNVMHTMYNAHKTFFDGLGYDIYNGVSLDTTVTSTNFPLSKINQFLGYIDSAYNTILIAKNNGTISQDEYNKLHDRIEIESLTWQYIRLRLYDNSTSNRNAFIQRCRDLQVYMFAEGISINSAFS